MPLSEVAVRFKEKYRLLLLLVGTFVAIGAVIGGTWWWRNVQAAQYAAEKARLEAERIRLNKPKPLPMIPIRGDSLEAMFWSNRKIADVFREDFRQQKFRVDTTVTYAYNYVDLGGDENDEVIVYLEGNGMCNAQGCVLAILTKDQGKYALKSTIMPAEPPVFVSDRKTNGWRDLVVHFTPREYGKLEQRVFRYFSETEGYGWPASPFGAPKPWKNITKSGLTVLAKPVGDMYKFRFIPKAKLKAGKTTTKKRK